LKDLQLEARAIEESAESHELSESEIEEEAENLKKSHDKSALVTSLMDNVGEFETLAEEVEGYEKIAKAYPVHADSTMYEIRGAILKMRLLKRKIEMQATALKLEIRPTPSSTGKWCRSSTPADALQDSGLQTIQKPDACRFAKNSARASSSVIGFSFHSGPTSSTLAANAMRSPRTPSPMMS
jgi:hypothetical protein